MKLSGNQIINLASFARLPNLKILDLSNNKIQAVNDSFAGSTNLIELDLSLNSINSIDPNWFPTTTTSIFKLSQIDLSQNTLSAVPNLKSLTALTSLDLSQQKNNALTNLTANAFERMAISPMSVDLSGNDKLTNFDNKSFCTQYIGDYTLREITLSSSAITFDKCFIKSIRSKMNTLLLNPETPNQLVISDSGVTTDLAKAKFCTCEFIQFAMMYGFKVSGLCDYFNVSQNCKDSTAGLKDTCPDEFSCTCGNVPTTPTPTTTTTTTTTTTAGNTPVASSTTKSKNSASSPICFNLLLLVFSTICLTVTFF